MPEKKVYWSLPCYRGLETHYLLLLSLSTPTFQLRQMLLNSLFKKWSQGAEVRGGHDMIQYYWVDCHCRSQCLIPMGSLETLYHIGQKTGPKVKGVGATCHWLCPPLIKGSPINISSLHTHECCTDSKHLSQHHKFWDKRRGIQYIISEW